MHDEQMIASRAIRVQPNTDGKVISIDLRLPWYRSLPLSCVENLAFEISGQAISRDRVSMLVNGIPYDLDGISNLCDTQWFVLDAIEVQIRLDQALGEDRCPVKLIARLRIPYKDDSYKETEYTQYAVCEKTLDAEVA